jgi:hypothetical protein
VLQCEAVGIGIGSRGEVLRRKGCDRRHIIIIIIII